MPVPWLVLTAPGPCTELSVQNVIQKGFLKRRTSGLLLPLGGGAPNQMNSFFASIKTLKGPLAGLESYPHSSMEPHGHPRPHSRQC